MKETIENLKEEVMVKNEVLAKYENMQKKSDEEVSTNNLQLMPFIQITFYKNQNSELMSRMDEYEKMISTGAKESNRNSVSVVFANLMLN